MKKEYLTSSVEETISLAIELGRNVIRGGVITLSGDLGAGKTIMAKGIALGAGITTDITSPTFSLMDVYDNDPVFYHFDLYRIENDSEFEQLSFEEYWEGKGISVIEWPERAGNRLPEKVISVKIEYTGEETRRIIIEYPDN